IPTAWMPANFSASPPTTGSAKNPSLACEWRDAGRCRQHSMLPNTTSAAWSSSTLFRNGSAASATFIRLTSPVKSSFFAIHSPLAISSHRRFARLQRPAAIDQVGVAADEGGFVGCQIGGQHGDLLGGADPPHRLAINEVFFRGLQRKTGALGVRRDAVAKRRRF